MLSPKVAMFILICWSGKILLLSLGSKSVKLLCNTRRNCSVRCTWSLLAARHTGSETPFTGHHTSSRATPWAECLHQRDNSSSPGSKQRGNSILSLWKREKGKTTNWGPKVPQHGHIRLGCSPSPLNPENPYAVVPGVTATSGFAHFMLPLV